MSTSEWGEGESLPTALCKPIRPCSLQQTKSTKHRSLWLGGVFLFSTRCVGEQLRTAMFLIAAALPELLKLKISFAPARLKCVCIQ